LQGFLIIPMPRNHVRHRLVYAATHRVGLPAAPQVMDGRSRSL
jgi:hypothetical protein